MAMHGNSSEKPRAVVVKFGGSQATTLEGANSEYLRNFLGEIAPLLLKHFAHAAFVIGGGPRVRLEQQKYQTNEEKDQAGMRLLREHAAQLSEVARSVGLSVANTVPKNEEELRRLTQQNHAFALALGGLKTGQSTDTAAVTAAEAFQDIGYEAMVVVLSNICHIFTTDPKLNADARPIRRATLQRLVDERVLANDPSKFIPGMSVALDPVAVSRLQKRERQGKSIPLWFGHGDDVENTKHFLARKSVKSGTELVTDDQATEYYE